VGFELRPWLCEIGGSHPFCFGYFGDRILHFSQAGLDCNTPILSFPPLLGWVCHHAQLFSIEMRSSKLFLWVGTVTGILPFSVSSVAWDGSHLGQMLVELRSPELPAQTGVSSIILPSALQVARVTDMRHWLQPAGHAGINPSSHEYQVTSCVLRPSSMFPSSVLQFSV
jgi:hypothetical protein